VLGVAVLALWGVSRLTADLGNEFLPQVDDGNASVMVMMPVGASALETNRVTLEVEEMVRQMPGV
jgi:multidrug efflux pump subunit AcrB